MAIGACDGCGKLFAGEVLDVREASCPECGHLLRGASPEEVDRHIGTEESLFYPTLLELRDPVLHERVAEVLAEHRQMEALIDDLRRSHPGAKADLVLDVLRSLVDRHTAYEQKELFTFASRLPRVTRNQLGLEIEERRWREERF